MKAIDPRTFLEAVYMNAELPLSVRMRAAIELLPFTHPKLAVTAVVSEQDFATLLDRRLARIAEAKANPQIINGTPPVEVKPALPQLSDRPFRRFRAMLSVWPCGVSWGRPCGNLPFCEQQSLPALRLLSASPATRWAVFLFLPTCCLIYHGI